MRSLKGEVAAVRKVLGEGEDPYVSTVLAAIPKEVLGHLVYFSKDSIDVIIKINMCFILSMCFALVSSISNLSPIMEYNLQLCCLKVLRT